MRLLLLLLLAAAASLAAAGPGIWWDEAVYLGLAKSIGQGFYSLDPEIPVESFRPPLMPFLIFAFGSLYWLLPPLLSAFAVLSVYVMARPLGEKKAILAALFTTSSFLFAFFSSKLLAEPLFIGLTALSLRLFNGGRPGQRAASGALAGLAFMTRYLGSLTVVGLLAVIAVKERSLRRAAEFLLPFALSLAPWMLLNYRSYGSPLAGYFLNAAAYAVSARTPLLEALAGLLPGLGFLPIPIAYLFWKKKAGGMHAFTALLLLSLASYLLLPHSEPRYLLSFLPAYAALAAAGVAEMPRPKVAAAVFVCLSAISLVAGSAYAYHDNQASSMTEASLYLKEVSSPGDMVLTQSYPFVYALAERKAVPYCGFESQAAFDACQGQILNGEFPLDRLQEVVESGNFTYALSSKSEPSNPPEAREYLESRFEKLRSFEEFGDPEAVVVYRSKT